MTNKINFFDLTRENTGVHMCDSGGENGRKWQQPQETQALTLSKWGDDELEASISLAHFLDSTMEINQELTSEFYDFADLPDKKELSWFTLIDEFMELKMDWLPEQKHFNSYNDENDLSQDYMAHVFSESLDWYYDENAIYFLQTHNGADARGGYSKPVICKQNNTESNLDWLVGWDLIEGEDEDIDFNEFHIGYHSSPTYQLNEIIKEVLEIDGQQTTIKTVNDKIVTVQAFSSIDC